MIGNPTYWRILVNENNYNNSYPRKQDLEKIQLKLHNLLVQVHYHPHFSVQFLPEKQLLKNQVYCN